MKHKIDKLEKVNKRLEEAEKTARLGSWEFNTLTGQGWWSKQMYQLFRLDISKGYPTVKAYLASIHPDDRDKAENKFKGMLLGNDETPLEFRTNPEMGPLRILLTNVYCEHNHEDEPIRFFGTVLDITEFKKIEKELIISEEQYKDLVENITDLICTHDLDGRVLSMNRAAERIIGHKFSKRKNFNIKSILSPDSTKYFDRYAANIQKNGYAIGLMKVQTINGEIRFWEFNNSLKTTGVTTPIIRGYARDVTESKKAEAALLQSFNEISNYKNALDKSSMLDVSDKNGIIQYVNDKFCQISKYNKEELIGQDHRMLSSGYHDKAFIKNLWNTISKGNIWHEEIKNKAKDDTYYWVDTTIVPFLDKKGIPFQYITIRTDITVRKQAEEEILHHNERYNLVAKATNDSIWDMNIATGEVSRFGDGFNNLFGYSLANYDNDHFHFTNLVHPEDLSELKESMNSAFNNPNERYWEKEYRFQKADGQYAYVYDKGYIIRDKNGKAQRMLGSARDITERVNHINAIKEQNKRLREIAWKQSHIVRAPLARMIGLANLLDYENQVDEETNQILKYILSSAHELDEVI
ncbi:MAG: PAS domain S-box protein, partial [Bacteroidota bacterium]|nr:PAS domain S-box protein [Bacteroidota bacterium]